jgi:hypothetical protein
MQKGLAKAYNELPPWSRGVVGVVTIATIAFIGYSIYKKRKELREKREAEIGAREAEKELVELKRKGVSPSYSLSQYEGFAQKLAQAMDDCGTTESSIISVFKSMKNKADVLSLIKAFGVRYYTPCIASQPISYSRWLLNDKTFGGSLQSWLEYDLTSGEISDINKILESNKIDYKF